MLLKHNLQMRTMFHQSSVVFMFSAILSPSVSFPLTTRNNVHQLKRVLFRSMTTSVSSQEKHHQNGWSSINAITLRTNDMNASCDFYQNLGLIISFGGPSASFTTMAPSSDSSIQHNVYVNLEYDKEWQFSRNNPAKWGRVIFHVANVDEIYERASNTSIPTEFAPNDAPWGERYFHVIDPAGHELSFAKRILGHPRWGL